VNLHDIGEFGLIERLKAIVASKDPQVVLGIDEDAAALRMASDRITLFTVDALLEGVHFDLSYFTFYQLGWRAMAANLSDIAAMGGLARWALVSIALPPQLTVESVEELYRGMRNLADRYGVTIVGGDTTGSKSGLAITIALLGEAEEGALKTRSGARQGDVLAVTGALGGSHAGLMVLRHPKQLDRQRYTVAVNRHLMPLPRVEEARWLAKHLDVTAMIDLSDGLASDLGHICRLSGVGAEIDAMRIPFAPGLAEVASALGQNPLDWALTGGEDYELLFTAAKEGFEEGVRKAPLPVTVIGKVVSQERGIQLLDSSGRRTAVSGGGWDHFKRET